MTCANGTPTGIGISRAPGAQTMVMLFEGGGACWDPITCLGVGIEPTAVNLDGFGEPEFNQVRRTFLDALWFARRDDPDSPFRDATLVFVPYCTGDLHAGTHVTVYSALGLNVTFHHVGALNLDAALDALADDDPTVVYALGISAGGYGVQINWDRIAAAFSGATTHILADGAQIVDFVPDRWEQARTRWRPRVPEGCDNCDTQLDRIADHLLAGPPPGGGRYGVLMSLEDSVLAAYLGQTPAWLRQATTALAADMSGHAAAFVIDTADHTLLRFPERRTSTGTSVGEWVAGWFFGMPSFRTVGP